MPDWLGMVLGAVLGVGVPLAFWRAAIWATTPAVQVNLTPEEVEEVIRKRGWPERP